MPELKRRRRAASEPDADSADATQEYSPYVPTFQSARPEDPNAQPTFTNESTWQPDYADDDADIPAPTAEEVFADEALEDPDLYLTEEEQAELRQNHWRLLSGFGDFIKMKNNASHMKSGKYLLSQKLSNSDIIEKLVSGEIYRDGIKVTIPEGSTSNEIIALLVKNELGKKEDFEKLVSNPSEFYSDFEFLDQKDIKSLEGFLYPSTYYFDK